MSVRIIGTDTFRHIAELQTQLAKSLAPLSATLSNIQTAMTPLQQISPHFTQLDSIRAAFAPMNTFASQFANLIIRPALHLP